MRHLLVPAVAAVSLAACATPVETLSSNMNHTLDSLVGQPVDAAFARLGEPVGSAVMGEYTVYGWGESSVKEVAVVSTGVSDGAAWSAPFQGKVSATTRVPVSHRCEIRVMAGPDGLIEGWHYAGNVGGCESYADQLALAY